MVIFVLLDGPRAVSFNPAGPIYTKNQNETLSVRCVSDCYPGCSYSWSYPTGAGSSTDTLYIGSLQRNNIGNYTCTARNTYPGIIGAATETIAINVRCMLLHYIYEKKKIPRYWYNYEAQPFKPIRGCYSHELIFRLVVVRQELPFRARKAYTNSQR